MAKTDNQSSRPSTTSAELSGSWVNSGLCRHHFPTAVYLLNVVYLTQTVYSKPRDDCRPSTESALKLCHTNVQLIRDRVTRARLVSLSPTPLKSKCVRGYNSLTVSASIIPVEKLMTLYNKCGRSSHAARRHLCRGASCANVRADVHMPMQARHLSSFIARAITGN
jgi:hypothetical protein